MNSNGSDQLGEQLSKTLHTVSDFLQKGIDFKDITTPFMNPSICSRLTDDLAALLSDINLDAIAGIQTCGYLFGFVLAQKLKVSFMIIRKAGKLPGEVLTRN